MKFFTRNETIIIILILVAVIGLTRLNLGVANTRARDAQRRSDVRDVANAVEEYRNEYAFFPPDIDGQILACKGDKYDDFVASQDATEVESFFDLLRGCDWGNDSLSDLTEGKVYLKNIPRDPQHDAGYSYLYLSNGKRFQMLTHLEADSEAEQFDQSVYDRNLKCGIGICNFALASDDTPVDRSIEEYEAQLEEIENAKK